MVLAAALSLAILLALAPVAQAQGLPPTTRISGTGDSASPLEIAPESDPLTADGYIYHDSAGQGPVQVILKMPVTKTITKATLGDFASDPGCAGGVQSRLNIQELPNGQFGEDSHRWFYSTDFKTLPLDPGKVSWSFSPTTLEKGKGYGFWLENGRGGVCSSIRQTSWAHPDARVTPGPARCSRFRFQFNRLWHEQGRDDWDCATTAARPTNFDPSMPTGWLHLQNLGPYTIVDTEFRGPQASSACDPYGNSGVEAVYWRPDPSLAGREEYVCRFTQFAAPPGTETPNGWRYSFPWPTERQSRPREGYLRLDTGKKYVALGDSFSSGLGAGDYETGPNPECRRSPHAYARRLFEAGSVGQQLDFVACQGARINALRTQSLEGGSQLEHLGPDTGVATVGVGGNDLGFTDVLTDCVTVRQLPLQSCRDAHDAEVTEALRRISAIEGPDSLRQLYREIRAKAPDASVRAVGYPRFFPFEGAGSSILGEESCEGIRVSDQLWVNAKIQELDNLIRDTSAAEGLEHADLYDAPDGHELCHEGDGEDFLNKVDLLDRSESFHPTRYGQGVMADRIRGASASTGGATYAVHPGETLDASREVEPGSPGAAFSTEWPGSDVEMSLRSPSGRVIDRSTSADDVHHTLAGTREHYYVRDPEPGVWTVRLYGAEVDASGEETILRFHEETRPNREPVARISQTRTGEKTVSLDASASEDPDGEVVDYLWDFGDGELAAGEQATHTFTDPGTYRITLVVEDDREALGFATASQDVVIEPEDPPDDPDPPTDEFRFLSPTQGRPALNEAKAGKKVRVRFALGSGERLERGYQKAQAIDCASGEQLAEVEEARGKLRLREPDEGDEDQDSQDADGAYVFRWKTEKGWAGECRRLLFKLKGGHKHSADFRFSAKGERDEASSEDEDEDGGAAEHADEGGPQRDAIPEPEEDEAGTPGSSDKDEERSAKDQGEKLTSKPGVRRNVSVSSKQLVRWATPRVGCSLLWLLGADAGRCPGAE